MHYNTNCILFTPILRPLARRHAWVVVAVVWYGGGSVVLHNHTMAIIITSIVYFMTGLRALSNS